LPGVSLVRVVGLRAQQSYRLSEFVDSEYWDHSFEGGIPPSDDILREQVQRLAGSRPVILALGGVRKAKGTEFLLSTWAESSLHQDFCLVVAGIQEDVIEPSIDIFDFWRALRIDRRLSDPEWAGLIAESEIVWACYAPEYDRSSGVAGRALQAGKSLVIREGSLLDRDLGSIPGLVRTEFGDRTGLTAALRKYKAAKVGGLQLGDAIERAVMHSSTLLQRLTTKASS
jgi:hypothetical protein